LRLLETGFAQPGFAPTAGLSATTIRSMTSNSSREVLILGLTKAGKTFRPSDWAERLAGVMSQFRPGGPRPGSHLGYSPWCVPTSHHGARCVVVHRDLRDFEPMAWDFCINFARDNDLQVHEGKAAGERAKT